MDAGAVFVDPVEAAVGAGVPVSSPSEYQVIWTAVQSSGFSRPTIRTAGGHGSSVGAVVPGGITVDVGVALG